MHFKSIIGAGGFCQQNSLVGSNMTISTICWGDEEPFKTQNCFIISESPWLWTPWMKHWKGLYKWLIPLARATGAW